MDKDISQTSLLTSSDEQKTQQDETSAQKAPVRPRTSPRKHGTRKTTRNWTGFKGKTLWDWLQLLSFLAIPLVVVGATLVFGILQVNLAQKQHDADQQRALDQQQATILQTYLDDIESLLLNYHLQESKPTDEIAIVARARTLTALQDLDPGRRGRLLQFIYEAHLIGFKDDNGMLHDPIINLSTAILYGAILYGAYLEAAHLEAVHLEGARLDGATLDGVYLDGAILDGATLISARLPGAYIRGATLNGTNLTKANLANADFRAATLNGANLTEANLANADFRGATLNGSDFSGATLTGADLRYTILYNAILTGAILSDANITQQLLDQVYSCKDATLPVGLTCHKTP